MAIGVCQSREKRRLVMSAVVMSCVVLVVLMPLRHSPQNQVQRATDDTFIGLEQDDPRLLAYVRSLMVSPSLLPYNLTNPRKAHFSQYHQSEIAEKDYLNGMGGGFFVEVGALDGESLSNTLYFEKYRGWTGLLVEPNAKVFESLVLHRRKAYCIKTGLAFTTKAASANYWADDTGLGRVKPGQKDTVKIKLLPLYSLLLALNVTQVDFFSLDIEGDEMKVLKTLPWDKIRFRLMCIEINHVPGGTKGVLEYLEPKGYTFLGLKGIDAWFGLKELLKETMDVEEYLKTNKVPEQRQRILNDKKGG